MKKFTYLILAGLFIFIFQDTIAQQFPGNNLPKQLHTTTTPVKRSAIKTPSRCSTMEYMEEALRQNPGLTEQWRIEGERQYQLYLDRIQSESGQRVERTEDNPIIIPIVFHLVDDATHQAWITDRDIYEQVELLNKNYSGAKIADYTSVIPPEIAARIGNIPVKFVLARRDPAGVLTSGIERRVNASPNHVNIKSFATGGLDAWDVTKYVNVWAGTFSGSEAGLLGIATFPFTGASEGAQGVVIGLVTLPFTSPTTRGYEPAYSEGSTLSHEIGHYFYLWHTFGDQTVCNNADFRIQAGWPLPTGAGPEGDDTPSEKAGPGNAYFGNPSMDHNDGCAVETFGIMYGSYMNYFDDRALFMFSDGMRKRVEGCINLYRPGLLTSNGATPPSAVTDAYLVDVSSRGIPERRSFVINNTPFQARVRNNGTTALTSVTLNVKIDAAAAVPTVFPLTLAAGRDTVLNLANISGAAGNHTYLVYTTAPNAGTDNFLNNDTLYSFYNIQAGAATLPFTEGFTSATFPPANWLLWNPNGAIAGPPALPATWEKDAASGATAAGAAKFNNFDVPQAGTLDELITPAIDLGASPGALLTFKVAHGDYDIVDVSTWDDLEVYISGDGGKTYKLAYKKSGPKLATVATAFPTTPFAALPSEPAKWRTETINLTPYIVAGQKIIIKFRNVTAFGNNTFLDDISVVATTGVGTNDAQISAIVTPANGATVQCPSVLPVVTIKNLGTNTLTSATINVRLNGAFAYSQAWTGSLATGASANVNLTTALNIPTIGSNTIKIHTTLPNGQIDATPANDTATSVITKAAPSALPVVNGFETTLLPTNWSLNNPNSPTLLWFRFNPTVAAGGTFAAGIDNYNIDGLGTYDDIVTPVINTTTLLANDSLQISFDLAYKNYPDPTAYDSLKVIVSTNCGSTWTTVWEKGGPALATAGASNAQYIPASLADWKNQKVNIGNNLFGGGQVQVAFRNVGVFGNVLWLDNINIDVKPRKDMSTTAILRPNATECAPPFIPSITVRNTGGEVVTGFKTGYILNGGTPFIQVHNIALAPGASTTVTFPSLNPPAGNNIIKMFVADPITASPGPDGTPGNDTLTRTFAVPVTVTNVVQGFEGTTFIPTNWVLLNPNNNVTWVRTGPAKGKASDYSAFFDNYNNDVVGQLDLMQTPPVNTTGADGVTITFDVAHKNYDDGSFVGADRLRVLRSTDCGVTYTSVYNKAGPVLATAGGSPDDYTDPVQSDWRTETITLTGITSGNVIVQFENRNDYGNNIFIDNINIVPVFKRDLEVLSVTPAVVCSPAFTPVATIRNRGTETVTAFKVSYAIGAGAPVTTTITGVSLAPNATTTVTLAAGTLAAGANIIKVYSSEPTTVSGTGDQYLLNDTITRTSSVVAAVTAPTNVVETFEGATFVPSGWALSNPDNGVTWQKAGVGNRSGSSSQIRNFINYTIGQRDLLYTPVLNYTGVDSVLLTFDVAAATRDVPVANLAMDTLEVLVTKDCGTTFTSVYKKWGDALQTVNIINSPQPSEFIPRSPNLWRTETINLTSNAPNGSLQVIFRNSTGNQNDVYVDNVNFRTVVLPGRLKTEGVIVTPNPFGNQFNLWFVQAPADLRYITVLNAAGQLIWNKVYSSGSTTNVINVDLTGKAAGIYVINLGYSDKGKDKQIRVLKAN